MKVTLIPPGGTSYNPDYPALGRVVYNDYVTIRLIVAGGHGPYSTAIIVTERTTFLQSLGRTVEFFGRHWLSTLCIVGFGTLILLPSNLLMQRAHEWIGRFNPEVMMAVLGFSMISTMLAYYLMASVLCFWYLMHRPS